MNITCFGTGDGNANPDRNHSAYLYQLAGAVFLLDTGEPVAHAYKASGSGYDLIDRIIISHLHSDHFGGLFMLLQTFWTERRTRELIVHLPADAIAPISQMLQAAYLCKEVLPFPLRLAPLHDGHPLEFGGVRITPFRTSHLDRMRELCGGPGDYAAYCFLIEADGLRIGHSADLGAPEDLAPLLAQPLDLLLCELAHFTTEDICGYLAPFAIRHIAFVHLDKPRWHDLAGTARTIHALLPGKRISFPRDLEQLPLTH